MMFLKCPYCIDSIDSAAKDSRHFCLEVCNEEYQLKRTHAYYYQVYCTTTVNYTLHHVCSIVLHWSPKVL